jgi:hypothetical protein
VLGATVAALLTGCTTTTAGQATPDPEGEPDTGTTTTESNEPNSDELPTDGAPKVEDPIDTSKFQENPCLSLTSEQSEDIFGLSASGRQFPGALGEACEWTNDATQGEAEVRFLDKNPRGLSAEYAAEKEDVWVFFEPLTVEGQPAVFRGQVDQRPDGACTAVIGASDEVTFEVRVLVSRQNIGKSDPCEVAADVAGEAVKTMKAG